MKTPMTPEILSVILAVQAYHKYLHADRFARLTEPYAKINYAEKEFAYYCSLPIPEEMTKSWGCYCAVSLYPVTEQIMNTQEEDLPKRFTFGY